MGTKGRYMWDRTRFQIRQKEVGSVGSAGLDGQKNENILVTGVDFLIDWSRQNSLWPLTFGLACCAMEFLFVGGATFDMSRFGCEVARPSPRQQTSGSSREP